MPRTISLLYGEGKAMIYCYDLFCQAMDKANVYPVFQYSDVHLPIGECAKHFRELAIEYLASL